MKVLLLTTWDNTQSDEGLNKYYEYMEKHTKYWTERGEKYGVKQSVWSDGTGKMYHLREFEAYEDYAKYMDDEEFQKTLIRFYRLVHNAKMTVLRGGISAPPNIP